jgi:hypothetical protein
MSDPTKTSTFTEQNALDNSEPGQAASAMQLLKLGTLLASTEYATGTITASATVVLPFEAAVIQSARVLTSGTAASVGTYMCADSAVTPLLPPGGASAAIGIASLSTDRKTITFPNTVTSVIVRYSPISTPLATQFTPNPKA